jgi:hypothetical protein
VLLVPFSEFVIVRQFATAVKALRNWFSERSWLSGNPAIGNQQRMADL